MKQKIEKVIRNKKVAIALMECAVAIGCIVIFCLFMIPKDRIPDTTHSYSKVEKVTKYKVVDNYITRVMPLTDYRTFKEIAENTLNNGTKGKNYTVKVYSDAEKTKEVTSGYIASGMIVEAESEAVGSTEVAGKTAKVTEEKSTEAVVENEEKLENGLEEEGDNSTKEEVEENEESKVEEEDKEKEIVNYRISVIGDMTKDGDINVTELTKITKCVIGLSNWSFTEEEKLASDLNGDGQIDIADIESCINYIVFGELDIQEEKYTVTFKDYDGSIISTKTDYHYGDKIEIPNDPTREADETYTYEFAGWNPEITGTETVTKNAEYIATYRMVANRAQYTIEHYKQEADGTYKLAETENLEGTIGEKVIATAKNYVGYGEDTENEDRIAEGIVQKDKNLVLKLYYKINQYTVTFKDEDGTIISEKTDYHYGDTVVVPENPTKEADETYTYEFAGWKKVGTEEIGVTTVTGDAEYIATYTSKYKEYIVTFKNDDGSIISEKTDYHYGDTVVVPENPTKEADETYTYEFTGWKKVVTEGTTGTEEIGVTTVTGDTEYIATYTSKYKEYTVTFKNDDGSIISEKTYYHYGDTVVVPENPTKEADETYTYEFAGWKKVVTEGTTETEETGVTTVTGDTEYIATYTSKYKEYTVTFKNDDGSIISEKTYYHYGDTVVVPENPTKEADETFTYEFAGWKNEETEAIGVTTVTDNAEYIATYESSYREYTIIFEDYDGTVISEKTDYHYGDTVEVPEEPTREEDETYTYEFAGWDKEITEVTKNTTYVATYINRYKEYTVTFKQDTGDIINSVSYHYGDTIEIPENPVKESTVEYAYTFVGWTPELEETVTQSAEYTATYEEQAIEYNFIFYNDDGVTEVARIENYRWGDNIKLPVSPTKEPTEEINYVFSEWKNLGMEEVSETQKNVKFVAQYTEEYFVARLVETETLEGVSYMTLQEAIDASGEESRTIKLLRDTEESVLVEDVQNITLDLNGKTITGAKTGTKAYAVKNYGILEITDTTEEKSGKIQESATGSVGYGIYNREGSLTIKSGMIVTDTDIQSGSTYAIYNQSEEPLIIEGGSIVAEAKGESSTSCGIYNLAGKEIVISGGSVLGNAIAEKSTSYGIYNATEGTINVSNGRVEGKASLASATSYGIYNVVSENVTISGGTVVAQSDKNVAYGVYNKKGKISVLGGTIEVTAAQGYGVYNEIGTVEVQAGKITMVGTTSYGIYNVGSLDISGGEIELLGSTTYGIYNANEMNIEGVQISDKGNNTSYGIYNNSSVETSIENATINNLYYGIYNYKGDITITSSIITANTGIYVNYKQNNNFTTTIESAEITSKSDGIYNTSDSGTIILKNVSIVSDGNGICNDGKGNIEIGSKDGTISVENPSIFGGSIAIYNSLNTSGTIKYYDGVLTGKKAIYGGINEIEDNSEIVMTTNEEENEVATLQKVQQNNVAKIGENQYQDLTQAVDAVLENAEQSTTIEILTDFDISKMVEIPENKNITIDLAGYTVTTYAKGGIKNKGILEITDSTEEALGKIKSGIGIGISNTGNLTFSKGTIESNRYGITTSVSTVIKEGGINAEIAISGGGNITVENGTIIGTQTGIDCYTNSVVNIQGGTIQGNPAVDAAGATINIEGGQIEGEIFGIKSHSSIVNVKNGNIIGKNTGLFQTYGTTQITGGSIKGNVGVQNRYGTCVIGTKDDEVKQEEPIIIGERYGIIQSLENRASIFQYYDGKIAGKIKAIQGSFDEIATGKKVQLQQQIIDESEYQVTSLADEEVYESGIAQIGDNVYTTVSSLKQAIDEIETNTEQPVKVTILNDFEMTQIIPIKYEQNIKIDLNGKTITSIAAINNSGDLEITDETEESQGKIVNTNSDAIVSAKKLTITKGTIEGARYGIYGLNYINTIVGAKDGEVDATSPVIIGKEQGIAAWNSSNGVEMYDGIIKGKNSSKSYVGKTEDGYKVYDYKEDGYYITSLELESPMARTGGQDYNSLQEAIDACSNGSTVEILRNVDNIKNTVTVGADKNIVLDLKGYTINSSSEKTLINNGILSIATSSGIIENSNSNGITIENNGEINLLKGTIFSHYGTTIENNGEINISNGSVSSNYGKAVQNNGILNVAGGTIDGNAYGIYNNENATLAISSGNIYAYKYCIYNDSTNMINITGGYIYTRNGYYNSKYGIYNNVDADINMTGGSIYQYASSNSDYVYGIYNKANGDILIATSKAITCKTSGYAYGIYNNAEGTVTLQKGTISVNSQYLGYGIRNTYKGKVEITGGSIDVASNDGYAYGVENGSLGNTEVTNGNISARTNTGTAYGIRNISLNPLKIKKGTIKATGAQSYGIYNNTSDLVIGENDESVSSDSPVIESDFVGIYINELGTKFGFYDGKVIAKQPINVDAEVPNGYKLLQYYDKEKQKEVAMISELDNYVLTYYLNEEKYESIILKSGSVVPEKIIEEEGYEFTGWGEVPETMPEEDINVYGTLTPKTYTVTYYIDGVPYGQVDTFEYKSNVMPREEPTKDGHEFSGWSEIPETMPAQNIEVRGVFTYTATFYNEDKTNVIKTVPFTVNDNSILEPEIPQKEGYLGWWSDYEIQAQDIDIQAIYVENKAVINKTKAISYDSIVTAITSVDTDGTQNEIFLTEDVTAEATTTVPENSNIVLDLKGYTITNNTTYCGIDNNGTLELTDSSSAQTGKIIVQKADTDVYGIYNRENAIAIIKAGNINVTASEGNTGTGVYNVQNSELTLGVKDEIASKIAPKITSTTIAISNEFGVFNFYDGYLIANTAINGEITEIETGYEKKVETIEEKENCYLEELAIETDHPYSNNMNETYTKTIEGAKSIQLLFDSNCDLEDAYDYIKIYNKNNEEVYSSKGKGRRVLANKEISVDGDTVSIKFHTDGSVTYWGFKCHLRAIYESHNITTTMYTNRNLYVEDTYGKLNNGKMEHGETYKFRILDEEDKIATDEEVLVKRGNAEFKEIQPDKNGIYTIKNIINDIHIIVGEKLAYANEAVWKYELDEEGRAINVVYIDGNLSDTVIVPESLDGHEVVSIGNSTVQTNIFGKDVSVNAIQIPSTITTIYDNAFNNCSYLKDISIDNSEEDMTLGNNWNGKAYVHYKNDKHNVDIKIFDGRTIVEESDSAEIVDNKIDCNGIFKFKVFNANGDIITNEEIMIISQGEYIDSSNISTIISPNEEGIYSIENINRNLTIIIGRLDGQTYQATDGNGITWNYTLQNMEATNVYYAIGDLGETVTIPDALDGFPVVSLHNDSVSGNIFAKTNYENNTTVKKVIIPDSVTSIGDDAFSNCISLSSIEIPSSVMSIRSFAFHTCTSLSSIEIPSSVTSIGGNAFPNCISLSSIEIPSSVTSIEYGTFYGCSSLTDIYIDNLESNMTLGEGWKDYTNAYVHYSDCKHTITKNIETGLQIQEVSNNLENENIPCREAYSFKVLNEEGETITNKKVRITSEGEFTNSEEVTKIITPNEDEIYAIENINRDKTIIIGNININGDKLQSTDENGITWNYTYQDGKATNVYYESGDLGETVTIPDALDGLAVISVNSTQYYPYSIFQNAEENERSEIKQIIIPEGITTISNGIFTYCDGLTSVKIPERVTTISEYAFYGCNSLISIEIPSGVSNIDDSAIYRCSNLTNIRVSEENDNYCDIDGVLYSKDKTNIIKYPEGRQNYTIPEGVTNIGNMAFAFCDNLSNIEIPSSVTSIGNYGFRYCSNLTDIYIDNLESNITFGEGWKDGTNAYVHYSDCKHDIVIDAELDGMRIEEVSNNLENGKIACRETYQFKLVNEAGEVITSEKVKVTTEGEFTNSAKVAEIIEPNEEGIYTIENINRNKTIKIGIQNGEKIQTTDKNEITWNYTYQDGQATKVYYESGELTETVNIPSTLDGYPVGSLYNDSVTGNIFAKTDWESNTTVKEVIIPDSVISIGKRAFGGCSGLSNIEIPSSVASIEDYAFSWCTSLNTIEIPNSVTSIGEGAFNDCDSLTTIELPNSVTNIGYNAFNYCDNLTDIYVNNLKSNVTFDYILSNGTSAYIHYSDCEHNVATTMYTKTKIEIQEVSNNLKDGKIACGETYQFKLVNEAGEVITSEKVKVKSQGKFIYSKVVEEKITPNEEGIYTIENINRNKLIVIGEYGATTEDGITWNYQYQDGKAINVYYERGTLPEVLNIPESLDGYPVVSLYNDSVEGSIFANAEDESYISDRRVVKDYYGYESKVNVKVINIPNTVTTIGNNAFERCSNLETINIPDSVTSIGDYAFYGCGLKNISMGDNVTNIGKYAFSNCGSLTCAEISNSITEIKEGTFRYCSNLTSVNIPEGVTSIGDSAFYECSNLTSVNIPEGVTSIGNGAFDGTPWYNNLPDGLIYLGKVAYVYKGTMPENTTIQIKDGTTSIQGGLFNNEKNLVEVEIPDSVTSIGNDAFNMCTNLRNVTMSKNIKYIGLAAFGNCTSLESIVIWKDVDELGYRTFDGWKDSQTVNIEANETPEGWDENWNYGCNATIVYGYTGE